MTTYQPRTAAQLREARKYEVARRDRTTNPAVRAAAVANIQKLNVALRRRLRVFGET